jgi:hypothetical protein
MMLTILCYIVMAMNLYMLIANIFASRKQAKQAIDRSQYSADLLQAIKYAIYKEHPRVNVELLKLARFCADPPFEPIFIHFDKQFNEVRSYSAQVNEPLLLSFSTKEDAKAFGAPLIFVDDQYADIIRQAMWPVSIGHERMGIFK